MFLYSGVEGRKPLLRPFWRIFLSFTIKLYARKAFNTGMELMNLRHRYIDQLWTSMCLFFSLPLLSVPCWICSFPHLRSRGSDRKHGAKNSASLKCTLRLRRLVTLSLSYQCVSLQTKSASRSLISQNHLRLLKIYCVPFRVMNKQWNRLCKYYKNVFSRPCT